MIIFPAVDLRHGKAVRLKQGRKEDVTVFGDDPVELALEWQRQGAQWLHVVDLDAAFGEEPNIGTIRKIVSALDIPVQLGGGVRTPEIAEDYMKAGASRLIIGTLALEDPGTFGQICARFPGHIGVSLDAVDGMLKSRGWLADTRSHFRDVIPQLESCGAAFIIYTDIERDGMQSGPNLETLRQLLTLTRLPVIVAGGVATLEHIKAIHALSSLGKLEGVISGRALYEKTLDLSQANQWLETHKK